MPFMLLTLLFKNMGWENSMGAFKELDVKRLGQVFTPSNIVRQMLQLRQNYGSVLEPSAGDGAFACQLGDNVVALEIDPLVADGNTILIDFFDYPISHKFDSIVGNPPYVKYQHIPAETKEKLGQYSINARTNLYLSFIIKCVDHLNPGGELIFITPRDFCKATSAATVNSKLYEEGSITHFYDLGDIKIFNDATPNCAIWRWEKGRKSKTMHTGGIFTCTDGQISFVDNNGQTKLSDIFEIKVGAVSGADAIFSADPKRNIDFVCSKTATTGELRRMSYGRPTSYLKQHKQELLARKIKPFTAETYWHWGRDYCHRKGSRIYVNCKTRQPEPFFVSDIEPYDGSVMALFPKVPMDLDLAAELLNRSDWEAQGFVCDGRKLFSQRSLSGAYADVDIAILV